MLANPMNQDNRVPASGESSLACALCELIGLLLLGPRLRGPAGKLINIRQAPVWFWILRLQFRCFLQDS